MKTAIIIPAFNEENFISDTLNSIKTIKDADIIVVDDGSSDNTSKIVQSKDDIILLSYGTNKGKGYALNYALEYCKNKYDIIGFVDADLSNSAGEARKLLDVILNNEADVSIARFPKAKRKGGFGFVKALAFYGIKFFTGKEIYSGLSGQRFFKTEVLKKIGKIPYGYGVEVGMTIDILKMGYTIKEVDVNMIHNETGRDISGFKHRFRQFYHILLILIKKMIGL